MGEEKRRFPLLVPGNWGSVIAKIVGNNVLEKPAYVQKIPMYVYEEMVKGKKLTEIINSQHENVKYLPGTKLPENVVATPDVVEATTGADILIFVVPHQFVKSICKQLKGAIKPNAIAISLIKGLDVSEQGLNLISSVISKLLDIDCAVLMGANIAPEVARENYCEATIGCSNEANGKVLKDMFQTSYFRITVVDDVQTVEMCGALKTILYVASLIADGMDMIANTKAAIVRLGFIEINIVALGAGFIDGMQFGDNTKAAVIRLGLMEMVKFAADNFKNSHIETFLESCGVADLVTTCYCGRNKRIAEAFVNSGKTIKELEVELLNGQKLQGPPTAAEVYTILKQNNMEKKYPLFTAIHRICIGEMPPQSFIDCLKDHPAHM
ncbi:Glycerol-3-phosphate dehydrogenase [NAD(+)], cytoplasmic [Lamellibrachia satsuma]|nr:Glycerol-3-phosphate dehydrogenase [NAD(+)], cytoplasmic [Lamellibrachia satsuma]